MSSEFRRGFKTEAERLAIDVRRELRLSPFDRLQPERLADHLGIPVVSLTSLLCYGARQDSITHLTSSTRRSDFSAMTVFRGTFRLVIANPVHSSGRRANSVVHELSHVILEHEPHGAIGRGGCRRWDQRMESEADWLAGALLLPRDAALRILRQEIPLNRAAGIYGVSRSLLEWRLNHTGARVQVERERRRYSRPKMVGGQNPPSR